MNPFRLDWKHFIIDLIQNPVMTWSRIRNIFRQGTAEGKKRQIIAALQRVDGESRERFSAEIDYVLRHQEEFQLFPYHKTAQAEVKTGFDSQIGLPYAIHDFRRLYFPRFMTITEVEKAYRSYIEDEDILGRGFRSKSPHRYCDSKHKVEHGDIVLDVGCAEGLFALDNVEMAKKVYLFEVLDRWTAPINATFAPFASKVSFVRKLVAGETRGDKIRLCDAVEGSADNVFFLKMDVEGWEGVILGDCRDFLINHKVKISCCAYHRQEDEKNLKALLVSLGFSVRTSEGYMLVPIGEIVPPYFRKGMIYARNF